MIKNAASFVAIQNKGALSFHGKACLPSRLHLLRHRRKNHNHPKEKTPSSRHNGGGIFWQQSYTLARSVCLLLACSFYLCVCQKHLHAMLLAHKEFYFFRIKCIKQFEDSSNLSPRKFSFLKFFKSHKSTAYCYININSGRGMI